MKAIVASQPGDPHVMELHDLPVPECPPDQVLVRVESAGVNFIDIYRRSGVYPVDFPMTPGSEGAGTVIEVGERVTWARVGDRVAWAFASRSYAEYVTIAQSDCYALPDDVATEVAAAAMLQGLTAHYLSTSSFALASGHTALVHAGAGGVGLLLTQMAVARGAQVITTVSTSEKASLSRNAGATHVIRYDRLANLAVDVPNTVTELTDGRGVDVVYDGVGKSTFDASLGSLAVRGMLVLFGGSSGQVPPFDLQRLSAAGSLSVTRPSLGHFLRTDEERQWRSGELFGAIADGSLEVRIGATYPLEEAPEAHRALEGRKTTGKVLLTP
ncbi:quinone oxidoreductase [Demequina sp. TTPB684]|uniref:quinone oxidoreductase family protein n=1 Tax=unclassified Demequina TaxID=2620311 RepID=UPI001CF27BB6|nr:MULTISPECIES: quinone oxidoreductase [unclassified Demequina]MCB2413830.1 quinone oxidoreductase [Demequina sp. TTPB684]UPU89142.1 quinone oxidoreductase [Demequina sp. TMPB413]